MIVAMTGATGNMGKETLREIMDIKEVRYVRALILNTAEERKKAIRLKKHTKTESTLFSHRLMIFQHVRIL